MRDTLAGYVPAGVRVTCAASADGRTALCSTDQSDQGRLDTPVLAASVTKATIGLLAAILDADVPGRLTSRVADTLGLSSPWAVQATWADVASHTSGLPFEVAPSQWEPGAPPMSAQDLLAAVDGFGCLPWTGSWHYSNAGFGLLGLAVERWTGNAWMDELATRLLGPLGMSSTWLADEPAVQMGAMAPAGQLQTTLGDLLRFGEALAGQRDLDRSMLLRLLAPRATCGDGVVQALGVQLDAIPRIPRPWSWGRLHGQTTAVLVEPGRGAAAAWCPDGQLAGDQLRVLLGRILDRLCVSGDSESPPRHSTDGPWWVDGQRVDVAHVGQQLVGRLSGAPVAFTGDGSSTTRATTLRLAGMVLSRDPVRSAWHPDAGDPA